MKFQLCLLFIAASVLPLLSALPTSSGHVLVKEDAHLEIADPVGIRG